MDKRPKPRILGASKGQPVRQRSIFYIIIILFLLIDSGKSESRVCFYTAHVWLCDTVCLSWRRAVILCSPGRLFLLVWEWETWRLRAEPMSEPMAERQHSAGRSCQKHQDTNRQLFPTEAQQNRTNCIGPRLGREPSVADLSTQWRTICLPVWSFTQSDIVRVWECPKSTAWHVKFTKCLRGLLQNVNMLITTYDHILIFGAAGAQGGNQLTHFGSATSWDPNGELSGRTHVLLASPLKVLVNHTVVLCSSAKHKTHNKLKSKGHNLVLSILDVSCLKFYVL